MKRFTMMELLFTISILVILIGIGLTSGTKVLRAQIEAQRKAEIVVIRTAIEQYRLRFGEYPMKESGDIDFADLLSNYIKHYDYDGHDEIDQDDYKHPTRVMNLSNLEHDYKYIYDPYEEKYRVELNEGGFTIK